jgi:hypothetical protein
MSYKTREPETPFEIPETRIINTGDLRVGALAVHGTTPIHIHELSDKERVMDLKPGDARRPKFEVRTGIAIFGSCNMDTEGFEKCGYNPFHPDFQDNYAKGFGNTEEEALAALAADVHETGESLWH